MFTFLNVRDGETDEEVHQDDGDEEHKNLDDRVSCHSVVKQKGKQWYSGFAVTWMTSKMPRMSNFDLVGQFQQCSNSRLLRPKIFG